MSVNTQSVNVLQESILNLQCSFCGKHEQNVEFIIVGGKGKAFICNECVELCVDILKGKGIFKGYLTPQKTSEADPG